MGKLSGETSQPWRGHRLRWGRPRWSAAPRRSPQPWDGAGNRRISAFKAGVCCGASSGGRGSIQLLLSPTGGVLQLAGRGSPLRGSGRVLQGRGRFCPVQLPIAAVFLFGSSRFWCLDPGASVGPGDATKDALPRSPRPGGRQLLLLFSSSPLFLLRNDPFRGSRDPLS